MRITSSGFRLLLGGVGVALVAAGVSWFRSPPPPASDRVDEARRVRRASELAFARPVSSRTEVERLLQRSDRVRAHHSPDQVHALVEGAAPSMEQQRAYYKENRAMFGDRTFEQAQAPIRRILKLRIALEHLETGIGGSAPATPLE